MNTVSNLLSGVESERIFDPKSFGYRAMIHAAKEQLDVLKEDLEKAPVEVNRLQVVSKDGVQMYTALHYAVVKEKWKSAALLINQGMSWDVCSRKKGGVEGETAIAMLDKKPCGLVKLFEGLLEVEETIDLDAWFFFLSSGLRRERRIEVLENTALKERLCGRLSKEESLVFMASLMVGMFQFHPNQTDFSKDLYTGEINYRGTINCSQFLFAASIESGLLTREELKDGIDRIMNQAKISEGALRTAHEYSKMRMVNEGVLRVHQFYSAFMGVERSSEARYSVGAERIRLFACEGVPGIFEHYGLLFLAKDGKEYVLNIHHSAPHAICQKAEEAFQLFRKPFWSNAIYTFMLPWQKDS